jgi:hypothetical protein
MAALALIRSGSVEERDPYWQVRAGMETLNGAALSRPDSWSWAPVERAFTQTSPGWNVVLGGAWEAAGFSGLFLVSLVAIGALLSLVVVLSRRLGSGPISTWAALIVILLIALPFLSPRATVAAQALFLGAIVCADWWRRRAARYPILFGASIVGAGATAFAGVGSWLHLSWLILSPAMALSSAVLWIATPQLGQRRGAAFTTAVTAGASLGVLAGPYGTDAWELSSRVQDACSGLVTEWLGMFTPGLAARWALPGTMAIVGAGAAFAWIIRRWRSRGEDPRVGLVAALTVLALPASLGGLTAVRFIGVSLLALAPLAAMAAGGVATRVRRRLDEEPRGALRNGRIRFWADGRHWRPVLVALLVVLFPGVVLMTLPLARPTEDMTIAERLPLNCRLFSDPGSAAPVILLRPDIKVWVDGRADYYGRERNIEALKLLRSGETDSPVLKRATCVMLRRDGQLNVGPLVQALDGDSAWTRLMSDDSVSAWVRSSR